MKLQQRKSKWLVVAEDGRVYSTHKTKKNADEALELGRAYGALANGWGRLTDRQREIVEADMAKRGVPRLKEEDERE